MDLFGLKIEFPEGKGRAEKCVRARVHAQTGACTMAPVPAHMCKWTTYASGLRAPAAVRAIVLVPTYRASGMLATANRPLVTTHICKRAASDRVMLMVA